MRTRISVLSVLVLAGAAYAQPTSYFTGFEQGDGFFAGPTRTVGSMAFPQAAGPGGTLMNRTINQGVHNQGPVSNPWTVVYDNQRMDQEINVAGDGSRLGLNPSGVRTGDQSWRISNWWHTGVVNPVLSPTMAAAGESGSGTNGSVARSGSNNTMQVSFDFRSAANSYTAGEHYLDMSASITDAPGRRMAFFGMGEWNGQGRLVAYTSTVTGSAATSDTDFGSSQLTDLAWGNWYNVTMTFTAVDGPNNDVVRYVITDLATNTQIANYTSGSWEEFYRQGVFGDPAGTIPGVDHVGFRTDFNADTDTGNGTDLFTLDPNDPNYGNPQTPFDQYSTFATPSGFYIDNFSITVTPTPGAAVVAGLGGLTMLRRRRR